MVRGRLRLAQNPPGSQPVAAAWNGECGMPNAEWSTEVKKMTPSLKPQASSLSAVEYLVIDAISSAAGNPVHAIAISRYCNYHGRPLRERAVRYVIKHLVQEHGELIVSAPGKGGGFRIMKNPEDLNEHRDRLMRSARTMLFRIGCLTNNPRILELAGQLEMEMSDSAKALRRDGEGVSGVGGGVSGTEKMEETHDRL
jgi:hypothetical protein